MLKNIIFKFDSFPCQCDNIEFYMDREYNFIFECGSCGQKLIVPWNGPGIDFVEEESNEPSFFRPQNTFTPKNVTKVNLVVFDGDPPWKKDK